ncbi:dipicolinate synthase subunit DpsA [Velocimicrobium porci]|uniref:Dipicolinate synthase subunit DpsA n=1 Tax=Velocimicrobium porci TaxID=2606634 RepID=A0A6L5XVE0_9FIRM|nr:dipicolinate synthase subunit DpsA [Velocimicrobium porci]MSS62291.1 dipicolinate synthase subunit DpsA [Velocimicrobium porci]
MYDIAILGGDIRQIYMAEQFRRQNLSIITYGLTHPMIQDVCAKGASMKETIQSSHILVSAIPFSKDGITIPALTSSSDMTISNFNASIRSEQVLFAGMISDKVRSYCHQCKVSFFDFMEDDSIAIANGIATAEGAIMEAINQSPTNLHKSHCLVLGFGRCAKTLAVKLKALDTIVTVAARKDSDRAMAEAFGFHAIPLNKLCDMLPHFTYIFNTIPALILDANLLSRVSKDAIIIDLASAPGGLDYKAAKAYGLHANLCLGIPGKVSPKASAQILTDKVMEHVMKRKKG